MIIQNPLSEYLKNDPYTKERGYKTMFHLIRQWAEERNLIKGATPANQMLKMVEELGELAKAIGKKDMPEIIDGLGDCVVVLTILAAQHDLNLEDCIASAYNEIKDRRGKLINGVFVKEV